MHEYIHAYIHTSVHTYVHTYTQLVALKCSCARTAKKRCEQEQINVITLVDVLKSIPFMNFLVSDSLPIDNVANGAIYL